MKSNFISSAVHVVEQLVHELDVYLPVRSSAARAVDTISNIRLMKPLIDVIKDEKSGIRKAVEQVLHKLGCSALNIPERIQYLFKIGHWAELETPGPLAVEYFIKRLQDEDEETQVEALEALGKIFDSMAVPTIIETLKAKSSVVRMKAVETLGLFKEESAIKPLVQLLGASECRVRWRAAKVLKEFGEPAVEALRLATQDNNSIIRLASTITLLSIGELSDEVILNQMLHGTDHKKLGSCTIRDKDNLR